MKQNVLVGVVAILAIAGIWWFRRKPMSLRQRMLAAGIAIVMLAISVLTREGGVTLGRIVIVVAGAAVLVAAAWHVSRTDESPSDDNSKV